MLLETAERADDLHASCAQSMQVQHEFISEEAYMGFDELRDLMDEYRHLIRNHLLEENDTPCYTASGAEIGIRF